MDGWVCECGSARECISSKGRARCKFYFNLKSLKSVKNNFLPALKIRVSSIDNLFRVDFEKKLGDEISFLESNQADLARNTLCGGVILHNFELI